MNRTREPKIRQRRGRFWLPAAALLSASLLHGTAMAQTPVDDEGNPLSGDVSVLDGVDVENPTVASTQYSASELEELIGQIALYPDDLLAVVLPASTYPLQIVQAARFLKQAEVDASLKPDEEWDDSIVALLNYPEVLELMNDDLDWTWQLGEAVAGQQSDVILAIETFRDRAYAAGNLKSDERQVVSQDDDGVIEIEPVAEDVIYVPYYEPERVVYQSPTPVYFYHPRAYPVYHYPYPRNHYLTDRYFWGVTTAFTIGWAGNHLNVYHPSYLGHPFYGYNYHYAGAYWRRPSINIYNNWYVNRRSPYFNNRHRRGDRWRPRHRQRGARPSRSVVRNMDRYEGNHVTTRRNDRDARRATERERLRTRNSDSINARDRRTDGRNYNAGLQRPGVTSGNRRNAGERRAARNRSSEDIRFRPRGRDGSVSATRRDQRLQNRRTNDAARINAARDRARVKRTQTQRNADRPRTPAQSRARSRQPLTSIQRRQATERAPTTRRAAPPPARVSKPNRQRASGARAPSRATQPRATQRAPAPRVQRPKAAPRQAAPRPAQRAAPRRAQRSNASPRRAAPRQQNQRSRQRTKPH